jgi:hypothetical protein
MSSLQGPPCKIAGHTPGDAPRPTIRRKRHESVMSFVIGSGSSSELERSKNAAPQAAHRPAHTATEFGLVGVLPSLGAFWHICGSAFHDDAHGAFMTLPPYTRPREGETRQLGEVVRPPSGRAFQL